MIRDYFPLRPESVCYFCLEVGDLVPTYPASSWPDYTCDMCGGMVNSIEVSPTSTVEYFCGPAIVTEAEDP